jgi:hypothetical protein
MKLYLLFSIRHLILMRLLEQINEFDAHTLTHWKFKLPHIPCMCISVPSQQVKCLSSREILIVFPIVTSRATKLYFTNKTSKSLRKILLFQSCFLSCCLLFLFTKKSVWSKDTRHILEHLLIYFCTVSLETTEKLLETFCKNTICTIFL